MEKSQCLKETRPEDFSELLRNNNPQSINNQQSSHQSSHPGCSTDSEHNKLKDIHSKYITVKQRNIKEKGILKVAREKRQITYKGITVRQWVTYQ